jgi:hypothetical protein
MTTTFDFDILGLQQALKNTPATSGILKSMLESFKEQICINECQFNRVVCILRPKCPQRHFQDLLLQSGYQHAAIPQFCYSVRLKELNENFTKDISMTADVNIYLTDFYRIFGQNKTRFHHKRDFTKILTFFEITNTYEIVNQFMVLGIKKNLIFVNLEKELVTVNPSNWIATDPLLIEAILEVLSIEYQVQVEITDKSEHNLVLTFSFPKAIEVLNEVQFDEVIRNSDTLMSYDSDTKEIFGELHIPQPDSKHAQNFTVQKIRKLFEQLNDIRPLERQAEVMSVNSKSKAKENTKAN